jgi:hypothetical protein
MVSSAGLIENDQGTLINNSLINNLGVINNDGTLNNLGTIHTYCSATYSGNPPYYNPVTYVPCSNNQIYLPVSIK